MISIVNHLSKLYTTGGWADTFRTALLGTEKYCSVVVSEPTFKKGQEDEYSSNGFSLYGSTALSTSLERAITNMTLPLDDLDWDIPYADLDNLDTAGLVAFIDRKNLIKVWKDRTLSTSSISPTRYLIFMRISQKIASSIRYNLLPLVGGPFPQPSQLEELVQLAIEEFRGQFINCQYDITLYRQLGRIIIELAIEYIGFIYTLNVNIDLKI